MIKNTSRFDLIYHTLRKPGVAYYRVFADGTRKQLVYKRDFIENLNDAWVEKHLANRD